MSPSVLVTGSSTGIGRATALHLDGAGWKVFAGVRRREDGRELVEQSSDRLEPVILDVTKEREVRRATTEVMDAAGEAGLDGLVNNAGVFVGGPLEYVPLDDLRYELEVNLVGQVAVTQALLPALRRARGRLLFVTSIGGRITTPFGAPYHASKWGLEAVAECLRSELAPFGIEVATIEPGSVATEIWRKGGEYGDEVREHLGEAGERLYGRAIDAFATSAAATGARGIPPERVAEVIERALTTAKPRARYLVGADARAAAAAHAVLGPRLWSRATRRRFKIP